MKVTRAELVLLIVALGVLLLGLTPYPRALTSTMQQAQTHLSAREYAAALDLYQQAAGAMPQTTLPWLRMGEIYEQQGRYTEATAAYREAKRRGDTVEALLGVGRSYSGRGDWAAAMKAWLEAQTLDPEDPRIYVALANGAIAQGRFDQAAGYLDQALQLELSEDVAVAAHALLGRLLVGDDLEQAATHFDLAGDQDMLTVLEAVRAEAELSERDLLLGIAFLQRNELTLARRHLERAIAQAPSDADAYAYLGHTLDRQGETVAARETLEQALALDPDSVLAHYFLGVHHRLVGNTSQAQAALWEALVLDPENAALRVEMAETFVDMGDYENAQEWYQSAMESAPGDVEFQLVLAHFYLDHIYQVEEAGLAAAQVAVSLAPQDTRAYDLLGWAYFLAGKPEESLQALNQALELDPELPSAHWHLGNLYASTGRHDLARRHLQRAVDLDSSGQVRSQAEVLLRKLE